MPSVAVEALLFCAPPLALALLGALLAGAAW
jgi:hypothetical protein